MLLILVSFQSQIVYEEGIEKLSLNCAQAAAKNKVKVFIEVSDGRMSSSEKVGIEIERNYDNFGI